MGRMAKILAQGVVLGKKTLFRLEITESLQKFRMRFCREKGARMRVQEPPLPGPVYSLRDDVSEGVSDLEICLKFRLIFDQLTIEGSCLRDL